jgi:hypothetical protein
LKDDFAISDESEDRMTAASHVAQNPHGNHVFLSLKKTGYAYRHELDIHDRSMSVFGRVTWK